MRSAALGDYNRAPMVPTLLATPFARRFAVSYPFSLMDASEKIARLEEFSTLLAEWVRTHCSDARRKINETRAWVRREVIEAGFSTHSPPDLLRRSAD